ncbi:hypothetical protein EV1_034611 [Malus domestica]
MIILRKLYYVPFENFEQRKHCNDARVIQTQWQTLVAYWDKIENKRRCATNAKNRKMLKTSHTTRTTIFAQIRNDYVLNRIYVEVVGPKKRNQVRGFGLGVAWADVPRIVTKQRGISREVKYLREAYEAHKQAIAAAEEKVTRMMHEVNEKAENMKREPESNKRRI